MSIFFLMLIFSLPLYAQLPPCCQLQTTPPTIYNDSAGIGMNPTSIAFSSNTQCPLLAVANTGDMSLPGTTISLFQVNPNCTLQIPATPYTVDSQPMSVAFSPISDCLAVANVGSNSISVFRVNPDDCTLTPVDTYDMDDGVGLQPYSVTFSPNTNCPLLAVANASVSDILMSSISVFTVNPDDCTLTLVDTYDMSDGVGSSPRSVAFSPTGDCLAVANFDSNSISVFRVNTDCTLTAVTGSPFNTNGSNPISITFSHNCLAAANINSSQISVFRVIRVNDDCILDTPTIYGTMEGVGANPFSIAFSPDGTCLAAANQNSQTVSMFRVNSDCTLAFTESPMTGGDAPRGVAFSPDGTCLVVANQNSNSISVFRPLVLRPTITTIVPNCTTSTVMGTADPNVTVTLFADNNPTPIGSGSADGTGNFTIITTVLSFGTHTITAIASNDACVSALSAPVMVTITPLQPPSITSAITNCTALMVVGTAEPNASITLFADNNLVPIGLGSTDITGNFSITTSPLSPGTHIITAIAGNEECMSDSSAPFTITNASTVITTVSVTCGNTIAVMGASMPNTLITLTIDNAPVTTGIANSSGTFIFAIIPVTPGYHCITVTDETSQCSSQTTCLNVSSISCIMSSPNLAFGTHCNL